MDKYKINRWTVFLVIVLLVVSALGYLIAPEEMLGIVGITGTKDTNFLVRTLAAALFSFVPMAIAATSKNENIDLRWHVNLGLACYMIISSLIDFHGYVTEVVNYSSVPSVGIRILIGTVLLITNTRASKSG